MTSKPALVLVPGACSVGSLVYKPLVENLKTKHGFDDISTVNLPTVDPAETKANLTPSALYADIGAVRAAIEAPINNGRDVFIVAHSYGATPSLHAISDLWKHKRDGKPGVVKALLLCSSLTLPGHTFAGDREEFKKNVADINEGQPKLEPFGQDMLLVPSSEDFVLLNGTDDPEIGNLLRPWAMSCVTTPTPEADVKDWKISYLITPGDKIMPEAFQKRLIAKAQEHGADIKTHSLPSEHLVQISHPEEVGQWIADNTA